MGQKLYLVETDYYLRGTDLYLIRKILYLVGLDLYLIGPDHYLDFWGTVFNPESWAQDSTSKIEVKFHARIFGLKVLPHRHLYLAGTDLYLIYLPRFLRVIFAPKNPGTQLYLQNRCKDQGIHLVRLIFTSINSVDRNLGPNTLHQK